MPRVENIVANCHYHGSYDAATSTQECWQWTTSKGTSQVSDTGRSKTIWRSKNLYKICSLNKIEISKRFKQKKIKIFLKIWLVSFYRQSLTAEKLVYQPLWNSLQTKVKSIKISDEKVWLKENGHYRVVMKRLFHMMHYSKIIGLF